MRFSTRLDTQSGDEIRKSGRENYGCLVIGIGRGRGSIFSFAFRSWQSKLRLT